MARGLRGKTASSYKTVGTTHDGIRILKPKTKPDRFTASEIKSVIELVTKHGAAGREELRKGNIFVEPNAAGGFKVKRQNTRRASGILPTQKEAVERAHELEPNKAPLVKRVKNTAGGKKGQFRKA